MCVIFVYEWELLYTFWFLFILRCLFCVLYYRSILRQSVFYVAFICLRMEAAGGDRKTDLTLIDCSRSTVLLRFFLCLMRSDGIGFACKTADLK